ncbi:MAG TPA: IS1595 family transposase [Pyrinomonadaceae bacterium]
MDVDNKYYRHSRISELKFRALVRHFAHDLNATDSAELTGLTRKSATSIFLKIRQRIAQDCLRHSPFVTGAIKATESHSCTLCICGRRGCGTTTGKPVFTLLVYDDRIHTQIIPDCRKAPLRAIIRGRHVANEVLLDNGWHGYDGLVDVEYEQPYGIKNEAAENSRLEAIENFWRFARGRLEKFNGVSNRTFYLHLKECEWRFNGRDLDLYTELIELLGKHPI